MLTFKRVNLTRVLQIFIFLNLSSDLILMLTRAVRVENSSANKSEEVTNYFTAADLYNFCSPSSLLFKIKRRSLTLIFIITASK